MDRFREGLPAIRDLTSLPDWQSLLSDDPCFIIITGCNRGPDRACESPPGPTRPPFTPGTIGMVRDDRGPARSRRDPRTQEILRHESLAGHEPPFHLVGPPDRLADPGAHRLDWISGRDLSARPRSLGVRANALRPHLAAHASRSLPAGLRPGLAARGPGSLSPTGPHHRAERIGFSSRRPLQLTDTWRDAGSPRGDPMGVRSVAASA